jgi:hypothetical protein
MPPSLTTPPEVTLCPGDSIQLNVVGSDAGSYQWSPPAFLSDPSVPNPWCTPDVTTTYTVSYTGLCGDAITTNYTVFVEPLTLSFSPPPPYVLTCDAPDLNLSVGANFPGVDFAWTTTAPEGFASTVGASAVVDAPGTVTVTGVAAGGLCTADLAIEVEANFDVITAELVASAVQIDCNAPEIVLLAVPSDPAAELSWAASGGLSFTGTGPEVVVVSPGTLTCTVLNPANGCITETAFVAVADLTAPVVEAGATDTLTCRNPSSLVQGANIGPPGYTALYEWTWEEGAGGLTGTDGLAPTAHAPGWHYLMVQFEENGCSGVDSVWVYQDPEAAVDASGITLPNVISPNLDGSNDTFRPFLHDDPEFEVLGIMERYRLQVFNRWGSVVYANTGLPIRWDGQGVAPGTYYVLVDYRITCGGVQEGTLRTELHVLKP